MSDIMDGIKGFLSMTWNFLMHTYIPGTELAFGVLFVGLAMIGIGFRFLSLAVGVNIGDVGGFSAIGSFVKYGAAGSSKHRISSNRKNDTR